MSGPEKHLSPGDIQRYVHQAAAAEELLEIDGHLGECPQCAAAIRRAIRLGLLWDRWSMERHAEAYERAWVHEAFERLAETIGRPAWSRRLRKWLEVQGGKAGAALRVISKAPQEASQLLIEGVDAWIGPRKRWDFAYVRSPMRIRGCEGEARCPWGPTVEAPGPSGARVHLDDSTHTLEVRLRGLSGGKRPPLVVLLPDSEEASPIVREPLLERGTNECVARFEAMAAGKYTLLFEP